MLTWEEVKEQVLIYSGSAHPDLARAIAAHLGLELSPSRHERFSNDNLFVQLGRSVRSKEVFIVQPISPPCSDHLLELLLMINAAKGAGAKGIHAVIPYYSYARSDKKDAPRISIAGRLIADLLQTAGATHIITMTLHASQVHGFFSVPTDHLTANDVFYEYLRQKDLSNAVLMTPDFGFAKNGIQLARKLGLPMAVGAKERLRDDKVEILGVIGDVRDKHIILIDDETATANTLAETITYLLEKEQVRCVTPIVTHGLFIPPAADLLNAISAIDEIISTDTVPMPAVKPERLRRLAVAHIFAEVIRRNILGKSIGPMFAHWREPWYQSEKSE